MKSISKDIENSVIQRLDAGESYRKIGQTLDISHVTVKRVADRAFPGRKVEKKGRPPKLTERDKLYCVRQVTRGGKETAVEVAKELERNLGVSAHVDTVRNARHEKGLGAIVKPKTPNLSLKDVKSRLEWAKAHKDWTINDWKRVIWTDETKVNRFGSDG